MKQVFKKKRNLREHIQGTGRGIDFCDECPFLKFSNGIPFCSANDVRLKMDEDGFIPVPDWCGNKKSDNDEE